MAISGPRYLVLEAALVAEGRWTTDLAPKPNCYLSADLAAAGRASLHRPGAATGRGAQLPRPPHRRRIGADGRRRPGAERRLTRPRG